MDKQNSQLANERRYAYLLAILLTVLIVSGYATFFWQAHSTWVQWTYILHTFVGILAGVLFVVYLTVHFQRTMGSRRLSVSLSGLFSALAFLVLTASGFFIAFEGQSEAKRWIFIAHVDAAAITLGLLIAHLFSHILFFPERRKKSETGRFPSLNVSLLRSVPIALCVAALAVVAATFLHDNRPSPYRDEAAIQPYIYSYGDHPFRPSQTETINGGFLDPRRIGSSENCAACHQEIAMQWRASIHSQAASDKAYQTNINLLADKKGMPATRYCEGCHAPVALLSGQLSKGGKLDTVGHMREGVSCMTCHGIFRVEHVKGVGSYRFSPPSPYLFEGNSGAFATLVHNFVLRMQPGRHKADLARDVLATPELCATCHAQFMDKSFNNWGWVKMQDDYTAWLNGPYSGQTRQIFSHANTRRCQDCHFPLATGDDPSANKDGLIKTHFNVGANTAVPTITGNYSQYQRTANFLQSDKVRISLDRPNRINATVSNKHVNPLAADSSETPTYYYLGEKVQLKVVVANSQVGHDFPGGTSDINEAWVHIRVTDSQGLIIYESGFVDNDGNVDPKAHFYKSTPIDRFGNRVWRHDLFNMIGDSFKRVIPPGESDLALFVFTIPDWAKEGLTVSADLNYRKLNIQYAKWAFKDDDVLLPIVTMASSSINIPLKIKPELTTSAARREAE